MNKKATQAKYHFSARLRRQLEGIASHTLTVVEAPSGFGKTTAVREYLAAQGKKLGAARWYTCLGESPPRAWAGICGLFRGVSGPSEGNAGESLADDLLALGPPTKDTLSDMAALLQYCQPNKKICIVIDNYQLFEHSAPRKFLSVLAACHAENLHLVVITQPLPFVSETTCQSHHSLGVQDFFFDADDIRAHCHLHGLSVPCEEIERIQSSSGGWIAAIRLQLKSYVERGLLMDAEGISKLVEVAVWNSLSQSEKDFMLALSLLDGFTAQQAASIGKDDAVVAESLANLLSQEFFIRYLPDKKMYSLHAILRDYLQERFTLKPPAVINTMYRKAAVACLLVADYFQAARFFLKIGDYDAVLSIPFTLQYFCNHKDTEVIDFFGQLMDTCPRSALLRYPVLLVLIAYQFMRSSLRPEFQKTAALVQYVIDNNPENLKKADFARVQAEFAMLMSFTQFNNIIKMSEYHRQAFAYLKAESDHPRSQVFRSERHWILGASSVMSVYWNKSGGLQKTLETMEECLPFYTELADGHAAGGEILMRAEVCLARGDDSSAEAHCHAAHYAARGAGQVGNCICAELLLAQIALLRGDEKAYHAARSHIESTMTEAKQTGLTRLGETCLAQLDMVLEQGDALPKWLHQPEVICRIFYNLAQPHAMMLHGRWLLLQEKHAQLYGLTDVVMELARTMNYILPQVDHTLALAVAKKRDGLHAEAMDHLRRALALALSDRVYLPFAEHGATLLPLLESVQSDFDRERMQECTAFCRRWAVGIAALKRATPDAVLLSPREADVARLARQRMSVGEIAQSLYVSHNTVKTHLQSIYRKLGIKNKAGLKDGDW